MRAALYNGKKSIEMTELPTPEAGENDIVVKNIYASICGTDVPFMSMVRELDTELQLEVSSDMRWYPKCSRLEKM